MPESEQLVDIKQVAEALGKSVESIRKYKNFGIIRVTDKRGNKDLFSREEILKIRDRLRDLRLKGMSLSQIADQLASARRDFAPVGLGPAAPAAAAPADPNRPLKVLVVDDDEEVRNSVSEFLESQGYDAVEVADGEEALAKCFTEKPDLLLLDLRLPRVDGYQVCQTLKGNPITSVIPIIMISALNSTSQIIKGIECGADDYIEKPFDLEELAARIKMVLRRSRAAVN